MSPITPSPTHLWRCLSLALALSVAACGGGNSNTGIVSNPMPSSGDGGSTGSSTGGSTGSTTGSSTAGSSPGGSTGSTSGTNTGGSTGGSTGGGSTGGSTGGSSTGGSSTGGSSGGSSTGGTTGGSTGGSTGGTTGGTSGGGTSGSVTSGPIGTTAASRLLTQGTFGPTLSTIAAASAQTYDQWFSAQSSASTSLTMPNVTSKDTYWLPFWWQNVITGPDQLRQRVAFALSQIFVISDQSAAVQSQNVAISGYYDLLASNALGNFRTLLEKVTLSPAMGLYLNMLRNDKENTATGVHADQNYAREVMQLFTIGLVKLNADGSVQHDSNGNAIPTYGQAEVEAMANTLTGWSSKPTVHTGEDAWTYDIDYVNPMVAYPAHHDTNAKTLVAGTVVPAGGTAAADLKIALDALFNHPNTGPFISSQLIRRLVTSNPSAAYVQRVSAVFADNGKGTRGDLLAVVRAILTDTEATTTGGASYGKLREPLLRLSLMWRAFGAADDSGNVNEYTISHNSSFLFGESALGSPTVFNFYQPDYQRAGALAKAGLVVPEFQITNENTLVLASNQMQRQAYQFVDSTGAKHAGQYGYSETSTLTSTSVLLRTSNWEPLAADPATLVSNLNLVLMAGQMPAAMQKTLTTYIAAIPATDAAGAASRVIESADLLLNSPQFAVQR